MLETILRLVKKQQKKVRKTLEMLLKGRIWFSLLVASVVALELVQLQ